MAPTQLIPEPSGISPSEFRPTATLKMLALRAELVRRVRQFFDERGYLEVETPVLSRDVLVDAHLEPLSTRLDEETEFFLQTSPEFGMKRLLAAGAGAIYQITRAFRRGEHGRCHNPEFTILEWYRAGETHWQQMQLVEDLTRCCARQMAERHPAETVAVAGIDQPFARISYDAAFERSLGTKVLHLPTAELAALAHRHGLVAPPTLRPDDRDGWLNLLLAELVEPYLGRRQPEFIYDYPASQAALAVVRAQEPPVAERFELYIAGREICNGYNELRDPDVFRARIKQQAAIRRREGHRELPTDNRLLAAMQRGLPPSAGVALGFDRLMMALTGAKSIAEVTAFPVERA